jgi:hypothetical protein
MRNFRGQHISRLAKETLAEVPRQLVGFAKQHRIIVCPSYIITLDKYNIM